MVVVVVMVMVNRDDWCRVSRLKFLERVQNLPRYPRPEGTETEIAIMTNTSMVKSINIQYSISVWIPILYSVLYVLQTH